jgi:hypothetical protein
MTKKEIAKKISEQSGISPLVALEVVQVVFDGITETLADEGRIELRKSGFSRSRGGRPGRHATLVRGRVCPSRDGASSPSSRAGRGGNESANRQHRFISSTNNRHCR